MPAENAAQMDLVGYSLSWKTLTLGLVKDADPTGFKLKEAEKKIGKAGDIVVDRVVIGMEGTLKITLHQVNKTVIQQLCPWWTSGTVPLVPSTRYYSHYANAGALIMHPENAGVSTDEDITLVKAFPRLILPKGDGIAWREVQTEWEIYPDQTQLLTSNLLVYGYYGAPPA